MKNKYLYMKYFAAGISVLFSCVMYAQEPQLSLDAARYWDRKGNVQSAAYFYSDYLSADSAAAVGIYYRCAVLMTEIYHYTDAALYFGKVVQSDSLDAYPDALFRLGLVQKNNGNYREAKQSFLQYQQKYALHADSVLQRRLRVELHSFSVIEQMLRDSLSVKINKLPGPVNTEYSEFNAVSFYDRALYFSSIRRVAGSEKNDILDDFYLSMIFVTPYFVLDETNEVKPLPPVINNRRYNHANFCFNTDKSRLYFTRCPVDSRKDNHCAIWVSEFSSGKWQKPKKLDKSINQSGSNSTQPCFTEGDWGEFLFFVSDRPGGFGKMDIWVSRIIEDYFTEPVNLGEVINTPEDELTPFYHEENKTLYFSSNWHEGLGGFDIFKSKGNINAWQQPVNVGYPLNSAANDLYFTINETDSNGFITSNRIGSYYTDDETCCNDIYEYQWEQKVEKVWRDTFLIKDIAAITQSVNDILPITLYFHNDEPDPKSWETTTQKDYKATLEEYYAMKEHYQNAYSRGLTGQEATKARDDIDTFFTNTVGQGFEALEQFTELLYKALRQGNSIDITIIGFASPLHSDEYNIRLSSRRISGLKNFIANQKIFSPYLDSTTAGNKLRFLEDPRGKRFAAQYVSDNPNDVRNSVYSIAAALERRIQIVLYKSEKDSTTPQNPELLLAEHTINVTQKPDVNRYELSIQAKNIGDHPLTVSNIHASIGGMTATISKSHLQAGELAWIKITFPPDVFSRHSTCKIVVQDATKIQHITVNLH